MTLSSPHSSELYCHRPPRLHGPEGGAVQSSQSAARPRGPGGAGAAPQRAGDARGVRHVALEPLDLAVVVLQARADGRLERVDGHKVREERQHILDAHAPARLAQHLVHRRHARALRRPRPGRLSCRSRAPGAIAAAAAARHGDPCANAMCPRVSSSLPAGHGPLGRVGRRSQGSCRGVTRSAAAWRARSQARGVVTTQAGAGPGGRAGTASASGAAAAAAMRWRAIASHSLRCSASSSSGRAATVVARLRSNVSASATASCAAGPRLNKRRLSSKGVRCPAHGGGPNTCKLNAHINK